MKKELDFGVFYTCYTEYEAVKYSLDVLYGIYPDVPVMLISDGGSDYSDLEKCHPNLKTFLEHDSRGIVPKINQTNYLEVRNQETMKESILTFLSRIERAVEFCKKPYLLIMEPDVLVRGKLHCENDPDLLGSRVNYYHWAMEETNEVFKNIPGSIPVSHYGSTPAIFKTSSFLKVSNFFKSNVQLIETFCKIDSNFANYDIFLTVFFSALGFEETKNPELTECLRDGNWRTNEKPLVHQFREKYPKTNYDGRHSTN
jgi:hypothetical protein